MNYISLVGFIASVPATFSIGDGLSYTSFRLRVHGSYLDGNDDPYVYAEEYTVICLNTLAHFVRSISGYAEIEVVGEFRSRIRVWRASGPVAVEVVYPCAEIVANTIPFNGHLVARTAIDDALIAIYKPDPA